MPAQKYRAAQSFKQAQLNQPKKDESDTLSNFSIVNFLEYYQLQVKGLCNKVQPATCAAPIQKYHAVAINQADKENMPVEDSPNTKYLNLQLIQTCRLKKAKLQKVQALQEDFEKMINLNSKLENLQLVQENHYSMQKSQYQMQVQQMIVLMQQIEQTKISNQVEIQELQKQYQQEEETYNDFNQDEFVLNNRLQQLDKEIAEIENDTVMMQQQTTDLRMQMDPIMAQKLSFASDNEKLKSKADHLSLQNRQMLEELKTLDEQEQLKYQKVLEIEFLKQLTSERPQSYLVLRNTEIINKLKVDLSNGSYSTVYFGCIGECPQFDKVFAKYQGFIDWMDQMNADDMICKQVDEGMQFICRPWKDEIEQLKNTANRSLCLFYINATVDTMLTVLATLALRFEALADSYINKITVATKKSHYQLDTLDQLSKTLHEIGNFDLFTTSDYHMITMSTPISALEEIQLTLINLSTTDPTLLTYLAKKIKSDSHYVPGLSKKKLKGNDINQHLNVRYAEFTKLIEYFTTCSPITYQIIDFEESLVEKMKQDSTYISDVLNFTKEFCSLKIAATKNYNSYYDKFATV